MLCIKDPPMQTCKTKKRRSLRRKSLRTPCDLSKAAAQAAQYVLHCRPGAKQQLSLCATCCLSWQEDDVVEEDRGLAFGVLSKS